MLFVWHFISKCFHLCQYGVKSGKFHEYRENDTLITCIGMIGARQAVRVWGIVYLYSGLPEPLAR